MIRRTKIGLPTGIILMIIGIMAFFFYENKTVGFAFLFIGGIITLIILYFEPSEINKIEENNELSNMQ